MSTYSIRDDEFRLTKLDVLILAAAAVGRDTGYGLLQQLQTDSGSYEPSKGTFYVALHRLVGMCLLEEIDEYKYGKLYSLSGAGKQCLKVELEMWRELVESVAGRLKG